MDRRWDKSKPPSGPFALNLDCPQAQGIFAWYPHGKSGPSYSPDEYGKTHLGPGVAATAATRIAHGGYALQFNGSSQYLEASPSLTRPYSFAAWFTQTSDAIGILMAGGTVGDNYKRDALITLNAANSSLVRAQSQDASANSTFAVTSTAYTLNKLHHAVGIFASATSRTVYIDGGSSGSDTTSRTVAPDKLFVGAGPNGSTPGAIVIASFFPGHIGECAVWLRALAANDARRLYDPGTRYELWYPLRSRKWFVQAVSGRTGTLSVTLGALTRSATGTVALKGTLTKTLGALTSAATGTVALKGTLTKTLGALTSSATGTVALAGTLSKTLGAATLSSAGVVALKGSAAFTLGSLTSTATGTVALAGVLSQSLGALTSSAAGALQIKGTTTQTLAALTLTATGASGAVTAGTLTATLGAATLSATGTVRIAGTASPTLGALTAAATGVLPIAGSASVTLGSLAITSAATLAIKGTTTSTLGALTLTATGSSEPTLQGTLTATLGAMTLAAEGLVYDRPPSQVIGGGARGRREPVDQLALVRQHWEDLEELKKLRRGREDEATPAAVTPAPLPPQPPAAAEPIVVPAADASIAAAAIAKGRAAEAPAVGLAAEADAQLAARAARRRSQQRTLILALAQVM